MIFWALDEKKKDDSIEKRRNEAQAELIAEMLADAKGCGR